MGFRFSHAAYAVLAALLVFGCIQYSPPQPCEGLSQNVSSCIYRNAVLEQNPFYCYSISEKSERVNCLRDASSPSMKEVLEASDAKSRQPALSEKDKNSVQTAVTASGQQDAVAKQGCDSQSGQAGQECFLNEAVASLNIKSCEKVADAQTRASCISQIARKTKDTSSCGTLSSASDREVCNSYVRGEA